MREMQDRARSGKGRSHGVQCLSGLARRDGRARQRIASILMPGGVRNLAAPMTERTGHPLHDSRVCMLFIASISAVCPAFML
ncbi:hypothetical protein GCM10009776_27190 [Microbacterium deminutum]|uniref:Uncharacterized protein n=1 Tax=Microbacterium deminutum TaxID=344164 RepID=A0ABN2R3P5_9MICO